MRFPGSAGTVHALSAFCHEQGLVLAHEPIDAADGSDKAEAELSVVPTLLARINWHGRVLTGDALHCQRGHCRQVLKDGGDYLLTVKTKQPALYEAIRLLFDPPPTVGALPLEDRRVAQTRETGHGRISDRRELVASTDLAEYLAWPGQAQVFRIGRTEHAHEQQHQAIRYGITRLSPLAADPAQLQSLHRGHWAIENLLPRTKDVNFGEDASLIHAGAGPSVMALLRDAAVSLLRGHGIKHIAACLRHHSQCPAEAVTLVIAPLPARA